jgi:hypothetical protein
MQIAQIAQVSTAFFANKNAFLTVSTRHAECFF